MIGKSAPRLEDKALLGGGAQFAADIQIPGHLHARIVRSPVPFGRIRHIRTEPARAMPGVVSAWSGMDVAGLEPIGFRQVSYPQMLPYRQPVIAQDYVRYVGEPVAVVFATDAYLAEDAADAVEIDIETLAPYLDMQDPPADWGGGLPSLALEFEEGYGDVTRAFAEAPHVIEIDVAIGRHSAVPLECRGGLAHFDESISSLIMYGAAKVPFYNRDAIASMVGLPPSRVIFREAHVGGGFGVRGELYPEDVIIALAALRLRAPVKWIEDRREHLMAANHSRDQRHKVRAAVTEDGYITAVADEFWLDQGAYVRTHAATVPTLTAAMLPGPYRIPAYRAHGRVLLTNKTPAGTYRSPGRYEGTFARERLIDAISHALRIPPNDIRRKNFITPGEMPFNRRMDALGTQVVYDSGAYQKLLERALERWDSTVPQDRIRERRAADERVGVGLACFVEKSGLGPYEGAEIRIDTSGAVEIVTGAASVGQGVETVLAQVAADVLCVDIGRIRIVHGQTDRFGYGMGAFASRLSVMAGTAVLRSAEALREKAFAAAADLLEADVRDLELDAKGVGVKGSPGTSIPLGDLARHLNPPTASRLGLTPGLTAQGWFHCDHMAYPYGVHIAMVSVEPMTGRVRVERCLIAYDVGRAINPRLVAGQLMGGAAQGIGGALLEEFLYSPDGQPLCTTFMDYLLPTLADMPEIDILITEDAPSPLNPLGLKGAGEGGITAMGAAVAAAVDDALSQPLMATSLPITPDKVRHWHRNGPSTSPSANKTETNQRESKLEDTCESLT